MNLATEGCYINKEMIDKVDVSETGQITIKLKPSPLGLRMFKRLDEIHKIGENPELLEHKG